MHQTTAAADTATAALTPAVTTAIANINENDLDIHSFAAETQFFFSLLPPNQMKNYNAYAR